MPSRRCNLSLLQDTVATYHGVSRNLPAPTRRSITTAIHNAQAAANRGHCADMHRHAQHARATLERRLDNLLGPRSRRGAV